MRVLDLFSGIGGFSIGLERAGMQTAAFCEIEDFPRRVLAKHWPDVPIYDDVRSLTNERLTADGITGIDVICGGFPCQDLSCAGKQAGIEAERSGLWSEFARLIGDIRPTYAIMENVTALLSGDSGRWFGRILGDLVEIGYDAEWHCIPASELGANHHRDRVWIVAYPNGNGCEKREYVSGTGEKTEKGIKSRRTDNGIHAQEDATNAGCGEQQAGRLYFGIRRLIKSFQENRRFKCSSEPLLDRGINGIPNRMARLKALGNAVVPQIPEILGRAIMEHEKCQ